MESRFAITIRIDEDDDDANALIVRLPVHKHISNGTRLTMQHVEPTLNQLATVRFRSKLLHYFMRL